MDTEFHGKRVLVTGCTTDIGRAVVERFVQAGATVFALDYKTHDLYQLQQELPSVNTLWVDVSDWEAAKKAVEGILPLNHLVNNAQIFKYGAVLDCSREILELTFDVNFRAPFNLIQVFAKGVIDYKLSGGTIVNISSVDDRMTMTGTLPYSCSKAALTTLTRCAANDLGEYNIRVNCIRPGGTQTSIHKEIKQNCSPVTIATLTDPTKYLDCTPLKRDISNADVANLVYFLSSENSCVITGENMAIDAGLGVSYQLHNNGS